MIYFNQKLVRTVEIIRNKKDNDYGFLIMIVNQHFLHNHS